MDNKALKGLLGILLNGFLTIGFGANSSQVDRLLSIKSLNPYIPHTYISGYEGKGGSHWLGKADILAPLLLREDRNLFIYGQGRYSDYAAYGDSQPYSASFGIGYRQIVESEDRRFYNAELFTTADKLLLNDTRLFGIYLIADYANSPLGYKYWDLSPGFETLGTIDFRVNGYIPLKKMHVDSGSRTSRFSHFTGHDEFFKLYGNYEEQGLGLDAEVGMKLFSVGHMPIKGYIDGYIFDTQHSGQIKGIGGRLTFQLTRYLTFEFKNIYDNVQRNIFMGGVRLYLNGLTQGLGNTKVDNQGIKPRLYEQIERNFANLGSGAATPYQHGEICYQTELNRGQIIFVRDPDIPGLEGDGTYENPYVYGGSENFQDLVDAAHTKFGDYSYLFFAPGVYNMGSAPISLHSHQLVFGRSNNFREAANAAEVKLIGSFYMQNAKHAEFRNFQLLNREGAYTYGIEINGAQPGANFVFNGVIVGEGIDGADPINNGFAIGTYIHDINTGSATVDINNSSFYGIGNISQGLPGQGMWINNESGIDNYITLSIVDSNFYGNYSGPFPNNVPYDASGLVWNDYDSGSINISKITNSVFVGMYDTYMFGKGINILGNGSGSISIGEIINSEFIGDNVGMMILGDEHDLRIGAITNSKFYGNESGSYIDTYADITIDNIVYSNFNNEYIEVDGYSFYAWGKNITLGNIDNSKFICKNNDLLFWVIADDIDLIINNISNSIFKLDNTDNNYGKAFDIWGSNIRIGNISNVIYDVGNSWSGENIYVETDSIEIQNIKDATFFANGNGGTNIYIWGNAAINNIDSSNFYANGPYGTALFILPYVASNTAYANIGNIVNSVFNANGNRGTSINIDGTDYYHRPIDININNIIDSTFFANGTDGIAIRLEADAGANNINNIYNSKFYANGTNGKAILVHSMSGIRPLALNINNISNSLLEANGSNGFAMYVGNYNIYNYSNSSNNGTINIGNIENSSFSANAINGTGKDIWLNMDNTYFATTLYSDPEALHTTLLDAGNSFNPTDTKKVCIKNICYPVL